MIPRPIVAGVLGALMPVLGAAQEAKPDSARTATRATLERHVRALAVDSLKGRRGGTAGGLLAAHYLVTALEESAAMPGVPTTTCDGSGRCEWTYFQPVRGRWMASADAYDVSHNIVAIVPGSDTALAGQWIIVSAPFDVYSYNGYGNATAKDVAVPGADDNASGTAVVLELARRIAASPLRRPVVFLLFDGAGGGYRSFLASVQQPADSMVAVLTLRMVGRLHSGPLEIQGASTSRSWRPMIDRVASEAGIRIVANAAAGRLNAFSQRGVPALLLTTGMHGDAMGPLDNADRVDYDGMVRVVEFAEGLIRLTGNGVRPWRSR